MKNPRNPFSSIRADHVPIKKLKVMTKSDVDKISSHSVKWSKFQSKSNILPKRFFHVLLMYTFYRNSTNSLHVISVTERKFDTLNGSDKNGFSNSYFVKNPAWYTGILKHQVKV